ncbi:trigger factor [Acidisphaera sp. L21]|uniref:trigger factor n=1 Tax=Acidisphaera sp. L21 TaxID=1641851 RepID=UPI00131CD7CA|nr:trigger factor [Acidisphaera sp. L21]
MQVTETLSEGLKRGFTVVVPSTAIEDKRSAKLLELGRQLKLPGFRPGKVPDRVVRQRYGTAVMAEVLEDSVNEATQQVLTDRGLRAATQPKVDVKSLPEPTDTAKDLEFTVEVELLPEITPPDFAALSLTRLKAEPEAESIDKALADIAGRQRTFETVEEPRPAAKGETLMVDYSGSVDGEKFPGGAGTDVDIEVAGPNFIPGFTEQLEGMSAGESKTIDVTFPEDYGTKALAGKAAKFEIVAKTLKLPVVPPVDEAMAERLGFDTLEDLKSAVSRQMQREFDQISRMRIKRDLLDRLSKEADFPVPPSMVDAEFAQIWGRVDADIKAGRQDDEDKGKDEETLKGEYRAIAERRVRLGLLLSEVGRSQGVQVTAEEMTRAMRAEAAKYQGQEAMVMEFFRKTPQAAENLRGPIFEDKVVDYILDQAQVEDRTVTPEELANEPDETPAAA